MKRVLRSFATGLLVGGVVGLWFGMNIGKEQPLLSNPFADVSLSQRASQTASQASEQVGDAMRSAGEQVEQAAESAADEVGAQ
jgi:hypothetical protein